MTAPMQCRKCALKHLSDASRVIAEMLGGYMQDADHRLCLMGSLSQAEGHLTDIEPELAQAVRGLRLDIFEQKRTVESGHQAAISSLWQMVEAQAVDSGDLQAWGSSSKPSLESLAASTGLSSIQAPRKPCGGCGGHKATAPIAATPSSSSSSAVIDYAYAIANRQKVIAEHPELEAAYIKAEAQVRANPSARPANFARYFAPIVEAIKGA